MPALRPGLGPVKLAVAIRRQRLALVARFGGFCFAPCAVFAGSAAAPVVAQLRTASLLGLRPGLVLSPSAVGRRCPGQEPGWARPPAWRIGVSWLSPFVASLGSGWRRTIPTRSRAHPFPLVRPLRLGSRPVRARLSGSSDSRTGSPAFFFRAIPTSTRVSDNVHYQTQAGRSARFKPASVIIDVIRRGFRHWTLRGPLAALSRLAFRARASPALRPTAPLRARNLFAAVLLRAALEPPSVAPTKQRGIPAAPDPKPTDPL